MGARLEADPGEAIQTFPGRILMPGLVLGHHHLYSALARGMGAPPRVPRNFEEILSLVWWRLDQALDQDSIYYSGLVGAAESALAGVTTIIDHHASPRAIEGSLDIMARAIGEVGLRGILCYEATDRHGEEGFEAGLEENARFLRWAREEGGTRMAGLVGAHAAFTLSDASLAKIGELAEKFNCGVHIHAAEDACDERRGRERGLGNLRDRFKRAGILRPGTLLVHGVHLDAETIAAAREAGCLFAHCPRSNMNNAVGYAQVGLMKGAAILGTDGISGDLFEEARSAWWKSQDAGAGLGMGDILDMLNASARYASKRLGITLGQIRPGAAADFIFLEYDPPTPLASENVLGHLFFGLGARHVAEVWVAGKPVVMEKRIIRVTPERLGSQAREAAARLWRLMAAIPGGSS